MQVQTTITIITYSLDSTELLSEVNLTSLSIKQQLKTKEYCFATLYARSSADVARYFVIHMLWLNTYIGTVEQQMKATYGEEETLNLMTIFSIVSKQQIFTDFIGTIDFFFENIECQNKKR